MAARNGRDAGLGKADLFVFLFVVIGFVIVVIFQKIAIFIEFFLIVFGVFLVVVFFIIFFFNFVGNGIQRHRMRLRNFQLALALGTTQDFALFHFVFVHINLSGTFRTTEHVYILRLDFRPAKLGTSASAIRRIIYPALESNFQPFFHRLFSVT
jgi:hypothetical protein